MTSLPAKPAVVIKSQPAPKAQVVPLKELPKDPRPEAIIRTSDRNTFKRCRRMWNWSSGLREYLQSSETASALWLGTGVHYALQDIHSQNIYGSAEMAFRAYTEACRRTPGFVMPELWEDDLKLGVAMMQYYPMWLQGRNPMKTYIIPTTKAYAVELNFKIPLPAEHQAIAQANGYSAAYYGGTFDRIAEDATDPQGLWIVEYKTAKQYRELHYQTDTQVGAYMWAATHLFKQFGKRILGTVYQQHKKGYPAYPLVLQNGNFSVSKQQGVSHRIYRNALLEKYGDIKKAPEANVTYMNWLTTQESENYDPSVRRDLVTRNARQVESQGQQILMEARDMLNKQLPLYPSPHRDCSWDCNFQSACISMDDGSDWKKELELFTVKRPKENDPWRSHLPSLQEMQTLPSQSNQSSEQPGT